MRKIFAFGNELFEGDEIAKELARKMDKKGLTRGFEIVISESPNEILNANDELIILDVVKGLKSVKLIGNVDDLVLAKSVTCHDLDLGFYLKLMKETGKINEIKIIGLPFGNNDYDKLILEVKNLLDSL